MLSQAQRLRKKQDFDRVYKGGASAHTVLFRLRAMQNNLPNTRFGVVVPNKVIKGAVMRNRKKRQIRSAFEELSPSVAPGYDVVVMVQSGVQEADYQRMLQELRSSLEHLKLMRVSTT